MLQRSRELLSYKAKKLLYYGQLHSHLCYGLGVWGPMLSAGQITELCTLQRKCVRLIDSSVSTSEAFKKLQILTVPDLINLEQGKLGYKLCKGLLPMALTCLMMHDYNNCTIVKSHSYQTWQKNIPNRPNVKLSLYRKSFLYQAIACYSKLDKKLRDSPTLFSFTRQLKSTLSANNGALHAIFGVQTALFGVQIALFGVPHALIGILLNAQHCIVFYVCKFTRFNDYIAIKGTNWRTLH